MMRQLQNFNSDKMQNMAQGTYQPRESRAMRRAKKKKAGLDKPPLFFILHKVFR